MRLIKPFLFPLLVLLSGVLFSSVATAADRGGGGSVSIRGILVIASDKAGASDGRLSQYEPTLRRILRFESYRSAGEGAARVGVPGSGTVSLGGGHRLEVTTESAGGDQIREHIRWLDGERVLMDTVVSLKRGVPTVLGGPSRGSGEVYAVIVIAS